MLREALPVTCPVRLLQGVGDTSVPWQTAMRISEMVASTDVRTILVKDGDHRLSRPQDLERIVAAVEELTG